MSSIAGSWIQLDFGSSNVLTSYGFFTDNAPYAPKSWTMAGSNDGTTWYQVDTQSGILFSSNSRQDFTPSGVFVGTSYRYYRFIVQATGSTNGYITPTRFYMTFASGSLDTSPSQTCSYSSDISNGRGGSIFTINNPSGGTNYFPTSNYPSGNYSGSITTTVIVVSGPVVTPFGNAAFSSYVSRFELSQVILSADGLYYIIACPNVHKIIQTTLDGSTTTTLFTLNSALNSIYNTWNYVTGISYNPSKTKFIMALANGSIGTIIESNLDGTNPIIKLDSTTKIYGTTNDMALSLPQCITLSYDEQYYLVTMWFVSQNGMWRILKIPVNDMSNPLIFASGSQFNDTIAPQQLCYSIDGTKLLFTGYSSNKIYQMDLDGTNVSVLYNSSDVGNILIHPNCLSINANRTGYIVMNYSNHTAYTITVYSSPQPLPTYPPTVPYQPPAPPAPTVPVMNNPPVFNSNMSNANTNIANPSAQNANFDPSALANQRSGATLANAVAGFYDAAANRQIRPNAPPLFSSYQQLMAWKQGMNRR